MGKLLEQINTAEDLQAMAPELLPLVAEELRGLIIETVSRNGGHLASNLGSIELTLALLYLFSPPRDKIIWDVGHQTYAWKILTGRREKFATLRRPNGISGFLKRCESKCDFFEAGHAGTAISAAIGAAAARDLKGGDERIIAVVGDAALGSGLSLEALNNIGSVKKLIVIVNDNAMSISDNVGSIAAHLSRLRQLQGGMGSPRQRCAAFICRVKNHLLSYLPDRAGSQLAKTPVRQAIFDELGINYSGPVDGHDLPSLLKSLKIAGESTAPIMLHIVTQKGRGYQAAENHPEDWHGVSPFEAAAEKLPARKAGYSEALGTGLSELAYADQRIVAITAAMSGGTGLHLFAKEFPSRFFDVGIAEGHAVTFAAGLAAAGMRPFVAVYSTFLQRAVDSLIHDVCLQNLPVTFCLDRAGVVGPDGATHHGLYDIALLRPIPNIVMMQPRDEAMLKRMLTTALQYDGPVCIRYPRDRAPSGADTLVARPLEIGQAEVISQPDRDKAIWIWALGDMQEAAREVGRILKSEGISVGIVDPVFIKPLDEGLLLRQAAEATAIATLENGVAKGGFGSAALEFLAAARMDVPLLVFGWPDEVIEQGTTSSLRKEHGLHAVAIADRLRRLVLEHKE